MLPRSRQSTDAVLLVHVFPIGEFCGCGPYEYSLHLLMNWCIAELFFLAWIRSVVRTYITWYSDSIFLRPVYTIQPVVKPVEQPAACEWSNVGLHESNCWIHTTSWTTGWMFVYTIQPVVQLVVKPVWQRVEQPVVSCIQTFNRLFNKFDNRLYRVSGV